MDTVTDPTGRYISPYHDLQWLYDHVQSEHRIHIDTAGHQCRFGHHKCPTVLSDPGENDLKARFHRELFHGDSALPLQDNVSQVIEFTVLQKEESPERFPGDLVSPMGSPGPVDPMELTSTESVRRRMSLSSSRRFSTSPSISGRRMSMALPFSRTLTLDTTMSSEAPPDEVVLVEERKESMETKKRKESTESIILSMFVDRYCQHSFADLDRVPVEIIRTMASYLEEAESTEREERVDAVDSIPFIFKLGPLQWRKYSAATRKRMKEHYGSTKLCSAIRDGVSDCILEKKVHLNDIEYDVQWNSTSACPVMSYIARHWFGEGVALCVARYEKLKRLHQILCTMFQDMDSVSDGDQEEAAEEKEDSYSDESRSADHPILGLDDSRSPQPIDRKMTSLVLETVPSPKSAMALHRTISACLSPDASVTEIKRDISNGAPDADNASCSFILSTMEQDYGDTFSKNGKLRELTSQLLDYASRPNNPVPPIDINCRFKASDPIVQDAQQRCPRALRRIREEYGTAKAIELSHPAAAPMTINLVNLYAEIRAMQHYINCLQRRSPLTVVDMQSPRPDMEYDLEPFGNNERVYTIQTFISSHPLTKKTQHNIKRHSQRRQCISSVVEQMATSLMRPLPLQPPFVIMDKLLDFLLYTAKFSSFVRNRVRRYSTEPALWDHALHLPVQMDFWIIPQCAAEAQIAEVMSNGVIKDYDNQCDRVPFEVGGETVGDIECVLEGMEDAGHCHYVSVSLDEAYTQFEKTLDKQFDALDKKLPKGHGQRYIFILDRRDPQSREEARFLFHGQKGWTDTLYILCLSGTVYGKYGEISSKSGRTSEMFQEGFIERSMECMLPLGDGKMIGAKHICNGYMFATSFHLFQVDKIRTYFMSNGYAQRFTQCEYQYYWPRLFMKDPEDGRFQDEAFNENMIHDHRRYFDDFFNIEDTEHMQFKRYTMKYAEDEQETVGGQ